MKNDDQEINLPEEKQDENLILSARGNPFKTEALARNAIEKRGLDPAKWTPKDLGNNEGYGIVRKADVKVKEKYWKAVFNQRVGPGEEKDVELTVNGEPLIIQRGVETIIPDRYRECADHTTYEIFTQKPNQPRKSVGTAQLYPYALMGEATEEEYLKLKAEGNKKTQEELDKITKLVE